MSPSPSQRIHEIATIAYHAPPEKRSDFLERECRGDDKLRAAVEAALAEQFTRDAATVDATQGATVDHVLAPGQPASGLDVPGYRVVKVLGRGGMGVVCLAQDLKLPRLVALKRIRSGSDADEKQKARFQAEAGAVAQLVHPNIVQIHDIGTHAGQPYFVLEYVSGGTLATKLADSLPAPEQAADITLTLAKAVQYAHQRGIIHRDLKPANVLLTAEGHPKITDFGLAKHLDADQALSLAGEIMGTPSYMAPEQAFGHIQDIGPATDVYALGAILYEMLTGRVPFKGETTVETLDLVRQQEPVPPRRLQPRVPRDLETICLKCLHKDRGKRYTSALMLAQDLERFLAGEAILARREGVFSRIARRVRRNRAVTLLGAALLLAISAAAFFLFRAETSRVESLEIRLTNQRNEGNWTDDRIQAHEALIEELRTENPQHADEASKIFHQSLFEAGTKPLSKPTALQVDDETIAKHMIVLLKPRDSKLAERLESIYHRRLRSWEEVFRDTAPNQKEFTLRPAPELGIPTLLTKVPCKGNVRAESVWNTWESATIIGIALHADFSSKRSGYAFLLETLEIDDGKNKSRPTFAQVRAGVGAAQLRILRNGLTIRKIAVNIADLPSGPLRLEALREADRLRVDVNAAVSLETHDLIPLSPHGFYGVIWLDGVLRSLVGFRQALPPAPGPLEQGDEWFAQGEFEAARAYYAKQAIELAGSAAALEARYKTALALDHLKRPQDALTGFEALAAEGDARGAGKWTVLASFQLLVHHLRNKKMDQADAILQNLLLRKSVETAENLMIHVPDDVRTEILNTYHDSAVGVSLWRHDAKRIHNSKRLVQLDELLGTPASMLELNLLALVRALRRDDQLEEAIAWTENRLQKAEKIGAGSLLLALEYGWMMREKRTPELALTDINRRLAERVTTNGLIEDALHIERARLLAAANRLREAEAEVETYFLTNTDPMANYRHWSDACLILGMLREQRGDHAGAMEAWRKGKYIEDPKQSYFRGPVANGMILSNILLLDTLCQDLDEKRTEAIARSLIRQQPAIETMLDLLNAKNLFRSSTGVFNRMWQSPRGKQMAAKMALQQCSFGDFMRMPAQAFLAQMMREEAVGEKGTPEQEAIVWKLAEDGTVAFTSGKMSDSQAMQLGLLWKRGPSFLGGLELVKKLDPGLRGPAAYFMGLRFRRLGLPAGQAFRLALEGTPANSPLHRLASAELVKAR